MTRHYRQPRPVIARRKDTAKHQGRGKGNLTCFEVCHDGLKRPNNTDPAVVIALKDKQGVVRFAATHFKLPLQVQLKGETMT